MTVIREIDFDWIRSQCRRGTSKGLFGIYSEAELDGWVGKEGPLTRECLGGDQGGRVKILHGVPHAFCLSD